MGSHRPSVDSSRLPASLRPTGFSHDYPSGLDTRGVTNPYAYRNQSTWEASGSVQQEGGVGLGPFLPELAAAEPEDNGALPATAEPTEGEVMGKAAIGCQC